MADLCWWNCSSLPLLALILLALHARDALADAEHPGFTLAVVGTTVLEGSSRAGCMVGLPCRLELAITRQPEGVLLQWSQLVVNGQRQLHVLLMSPDLQHLAHVGGAPRHRGGAAATMDVGRASSTPCYARVDASMDWSVWGLHRTMLELVQRVGNNPNSVRPPAVSPGGVRGGMPSSAAERSLGLVPGMQSGAYWGAMSTVVKQEVRSSRALMLGRALPKDVAHSKATPPLPVPLPFPPSPPLLLMLVAAVLRTYLRCTLRTSAPRCRPT